MHITLSSKYHGTCSWKKAKVNMIDMTTQTKDFDYLQPNGKVYC